eukprot:gene13316-13428_t
MDALAVVLHEPERLELSRLALTAPGESEIVVDIEFSGISSGTEKLLWQGTMPNFPGMGYPLVPGYESVGRVTEASSTSPLKPGQRVFVPGAKCFGDIRGLFGGAASRLVVPAARVIPIDEEMGEQGTLLALAATAYHAAPHPGPQPDLIVGHGVLGRLLARIVIANGAPPPTVWEINPVRSSGAVGYEVVHPDSDPRRDYRCICDVSGDSSLLDQLVGRMAPAGEIVLAGFYTERMSFAFAPAFMREMRMRIAAQFVPSDIEAVKALISGGRLALDGLITHRANPRDATQAYQTAFTKPDCLKMILNWSHNLRDEAAIEPDPVATGPLGGNVGVAGMVINKDDGTGEAAAFAEAVGIPVLSAIPANEDIRRKSANYEIIGRPGSEWAPMFEMLAEQVASAPPVRPTPLSHENLLNLFKGDAVGRSVVLEPATLEDMCGPGASIVKPSLEVIYESV